MPEGESPDQHRNRFKWLHREGALSDEELDQRLAVVDVNGPDWAESAVPVPSMSLN
ncbi:hypothetical protein [Luteimonas salinilitoris]|uniref:SHOCT domain-containing protein n=1 Tax=Luteimonas salinilitoris TaxID=3237697 RepID=A0ABV4HZZ3_9GAMM